VLLDPDGQVLFADYAELTQDMKSGVLRDLRATLAENGRLAANGARRTDGQINDLSRVVYSTCNLCANDPSKAPLWQIRALSATRSAQEDRRSGCRDGAAASRSAICRISGTPILR
jgi:LPS-assembly protein